MPADLKPLLDDLAAESAVVGALLDPLDPADWDRPTPAVGWTIADQVTHLAYFDDVTLLSLPDPDRFRDEARALAAGGDDDPDRVAAAHRHVLVHGDIHEHQLLVTEGEITGILDWETARVDHPFWDFDLGEWGTGLWRRHRREFSGLWATAWREYAAVRGIDPDPAPLETAFRLRQALALLDGDGLSDPAVAGTVEEHVAPIC